MNGIRVSQITDYMPQIASLKNRHGKSRDYREGVGNSLAFYDTDFYRRQARVIVDGKNDETEYKIYNATDLMEDLIQQNKKIISFPFSGYWLDVGKHEDFEKAQTDINSIKF